jgi:predicted permease
MMSAVIQDLRYAIRQMRKTPGFAAVAVITLALGIGANTAIFSLLNAVMLRTLPVKDPGQLILLKWKAKGIPQTKASSSYANCPQGSGPALQGGDIISDVPLDSQGCSFSFPFFEDLQNNRQVFSAVGAFVPAEFSMNSEGHTHLVRGLLVSGDFFRTLGLQAAMGRVLSPRDDEDGAPPTLVVSYQFWESHLGADREIVGKYVRIGKTLFAVAGVTRPEFATFDPGVSSDVWLPLAFKGALPPYRAPETSAGAIWIEVLGRLQPGVGLDRAAAALSSAFSVSTTNGPDAVFKISDAPQIELYKMARGLATLRRSFSQPLFTLLTAVVLVLVLSCVNIAGLMLARSASRMKELGTRLALGATRSRVIRQLLAESMVLSIAGGGIGLLLGDIGARGLKSFFARNWYRPLELDVRADPHVLTFTLAVSVLVGVGFGLAPAISATRQDVASVFRAAASGLTGRGRRLNLGNVIVLSQIVLAVPVLVGAGLIVRTFGNLQAQRVGFDPHQLVVFRIDSTYSHKDPSKLYENVQEQLAALPGVLSVSRSAVSLLSNEGMAGPIFLSGQANPAARAHFLPMSENFFETMRIPLLEGRVFSDKKREQAASKMIPTEVVVNHALVRQLFGRENPLGKHFRSPTGSEFEITGVVADAKYGTMRETIWPTVYASLANWDGNVYYEVRTATDPNFLMPDIRAALERFDKSLLIVGMKTEVEQIAQDTYQERLLASLSGSLAALALIVVCIGTYGLLAFQVVRRTQEIGIRLAIGAKRGDVLWLVVARGAAIVLTGVLVGSLAAMAVTRYLHSVLFGVKPTDPLTMIAAAFLLIATAVLASYMPARRAAKVDPMVALRYE